MGIVNDPLPNIYAAEGSNWVKGLAHNIFSHMGCYLPFGKAIVLQWRHPRCLYRCYNLGDHFMDIVHLQKCPTTLHTNCVVYNVVTIVTVNDSKPRRHGMC